jgi:hypothetical protein
LRYAPNSGEIFSQKASSWNLYFGDEYIIIFNLSKKKTLEFAENFVHKIISFLDHKFGQNQTLDSYALRSTNRNLDLNLMAIIKPKKDYFSRRKFFDKLNIGDRWRRWKRWPMEKVKANFE